ncbi:hypothetical protein ACF05X_30780 [Streptomyces werraensis]|uniref:hypothetical protein n=1 Tax=Streptomyces werraensis TaxID=68284 RepID=UPI0036F99307
MPVASRADALGRGREGDAFRAGEQQALVVGRVAVPAQEELAGGAVPVAVEDVVQAVLFDSRGHPLLVLLPRPVTFLLLLGVQGALDRLLRSGQKAQEKQEHEEWGAKYRTEHGQCGAAGRVEWWVARGLQSGGRRLRDCPIQHHSPASERMSRRPAIPPCLLLRAMPAVSLPMPDRIG